MFDTHYDLLTIAYKAYLTGDYSYLEKISKYFGKNNVKGVIANLYFMSRDEMEEEICKDYYRDDVSVLDMFIKAKEVLDTYLPDINIVYSLEGADYIKNPQELVELYNAGLDSLILCWNTENKYGSGNRSEKGLTTAGKELINKAIELGMGIDLSHANGKTFDDIIDVIKEKQGKGFDVCCYASHSNSRVLCNRDRNLTDEQILKLHEVGGLIGVFSNKNFVVSVEQQNSDTNYREKYLDHIGHVMELVGSSNLMVATDDMDFCSSIDPIYGMLSIYDYDKISYELGDDLTKRFGVSTAYRVFYENAKEKVYNYIKNMRKNERGVLK